MITITTTITTATTMLADAALHRLLAWTSPSYPVGSFTYSHGLETAVEDGRITTAAHVTAYVEAVLAHGGGWIDAVLFVHASFLSVTRKAWPHPALDAFAARNGDHPMAHATVMALACAVHAIPLEPALHGWLHATAANLVSAGVRLVPLGQTDGQLALAALSHAIPAIAEKALVTPLEDLGTAAPDLELASLSHETLYTRLFRS